MEETQNPSPENFEQKPSIHSLLQKAKAVAGTYSERSSGTEQDVRKEVGELQNKAKTNSLSYFDTLKWEMNDDYLQMQRTANTVNGDLSKLQPVDREKLLRSQLKLTTKEITGRALQKYFDIVQQYDDLRQQSIANGVPVDAARDKAVIDHLQLVLGKLDERRGQAMLITQALDTQTKEQQIAQADRTDRELWNALGAGNQEEKDAKKQKEWIVPASEAFLSLLDTRYHHLLKQANEGSRDDVATKVAKDAEGRIKKANEVIIPILQSRGDTIAQTSDGSLVHLTPGDADNADDLAKLQKVFAESGLDYQAYQTDFATIRQAKNSADQIFKTLGKDTIERNAKFTTSMIDFQINRAKLATIRHQFDQQYDLPATGERRDKGEKLDQFEKFLKSQQDSSFTQIQEHLGFVRNRILSVGALEYTEQMWNEDGRIFLAQMADLLTNIETMYLPKFKAEWPGPLEHLRGAANWPHDKEKERLMGDIPRLVGWPTYEDGPNKGKLKNWTDLTPEDKRAMKDKQDSVRKATKRFEDTGTLDRFQKTTELTQSLSKNPKFNAQELLSSGTIDPESLPAVRLSAENVEQTVTNLINQGKTEKDARRMVLLLTFKQMQEDGHAYGEAAGTLAKDIHAVIGVHIDFENAAVKFANEQLQWALRTLFYGASAVAEARMAYLFAFGKRSRNARAAEKARRAADTAQEAGKAKQAVKSSTAEKLSEAKKPVQAKTTKPFDPKAFEKTTEEAAKAVKGTAEPVEQVAKTVGAAEKTTETLRTFDELKVAINEAKAAKNNKLLTDLLKSPLLQEAAQAGNIEAKALLRVAKLLSAGKWALRALPFVGTLVDAALLGANEMDIADAKKTHNVGMQQTLESKRGTLTGQGAVALGMLAMSGPQILFTAPVAVATSIYTNKVYDSIVTWEKSSADWLQESPQALLQHLQELPQNYVDVGQRAAVGYTTVGYGWRWMKSFWNPEGVEKQDRAQYDTIQAVNANKRQEILTAYILKTMKVSAIPNETEETLQARVKTMVTDRLNYFSRITSGTFNLPAQSAVYYETADEFSQLADVRRKREESGAPLVMEYNWNGEKHALDLNALDYVSGPKDGSNPSQLSDKFNATLNQYHQEVLPQIEALEELKQIR